MVKIMHRLGHFPYYQTFVRFSCSNIKLILALCQVATFLSLLLSLLGITVFIINPGILYAETH